jgi:C4-type Zn-finger protein
MIWATARKIMNRGVDMTKEEHLEVEALCPECGHAFKAYVDRLVPEEKPDNSKRPVSCPVCGCGQCDIA